MREQCYESRMTIEQKRFDKLKEMLQEAINNNMTDLINFEDFYAKSVSKLIDRATGEIAEDTTMNYVADRLVQIASLEQRPKFQITKSTAMGYLKILNGLYNLLPNSVTNPGTHKLQGNLIGFSWLKNTDDVIDYIMNKGTVDRANTITGKTGIR